MKITRPAAVQPVVIEMTEAEAKDLRWFLGNLSTTKVATIFGVNVSEKDSQRVYQMTYDLFRTLRATSI